MFMNIKELFVRLNKRAKTTYKAIERWGISHPVGLSLMTLVLSVSLSVVLSH